MRIALVIWAIGRGGGERVLSILANSWAEQGREIHVLTLEPAMSPICYALHPSVVVHRVGCDKPTGGTTRRRLRIPVALRLRWAFRKLRPDAVISFMSSGNIRALLATLGTRIPVFACEHCDPRTRSIGKLNETLRRRLYPFAASVVALSKEAMSFFPPKIQARGTIIPNPVLAPPTGCRAATASEDFRPKRLISIGRLEPVKRFDRLIDGFSRAVKDHPQWVLEIWGEGPERERLQQLINQLGLASKARLCGTTDNVYKVLSQAHLFALTSETEGFPMALCEAMACGLPVVSMDCPSGPRQIVREGVDGVLTPNGEVPAFAVTLGRLMGDAAERSRLASRAPEVIDRFGIVPVMKQWDHLLGRFG